MGGVWLRGRSLTDFRRGRRNLPLPLERGRRRRGPKGVHGGAGGLGGGLRGSPLTDFRRGRRNPSAGSGQVLPLPSERVKSGAPGVGSAKRRWCCGVTGWVEASASDRREGRGMASEKALGGNRVGSAGVGWALRGCGSTRPFEDFGPAHHERGGQREKRAPTRGAPTWCAGRAVGDIESAQERVCLGGGGAGGG